MGAHGGSASHGGEWLTPNVPNGGRCVSPELVAAKGRTSSGEKRTVGLESQARYWPTPDTGHERINRSRSPGAADRPTIALAAKLWASPTAHDGRRPGADLHSTQGANLNRDAAMWMTPSVSNSQGNEYTRDRGIPGQERLTLTGQAQHWPTPRATDGTKGGPNQAGSKGDLMLPSAAAQWPTPMAMDAEQSGSPKASMMTLDRASKQWPTPASRDYRTPNSQASQASRNHTGGEQLPNFVEHHFSHPVLSTLDGRELSPTARTLPRRLNPAFGCWLMGWPIWWTNPALTSCARSEMESYRCRLQWHLSNLCGALPLELEEE